MLFAKRFWSGLQDGPITLTFRTWDRPRVVVGRRYRTRAGVLAADLAASLGREKLPFERGVRRLKEFGLTESLPVGTVSPRAGRPF